MSPALYVVAHEDDDLLFLSPDLVRDLASGRPVVTVFVTAGDAGLDSDYWLEREHGIEAAYALMAGTTEHWITDAVDAGGPRTRTLMDRPEVSVVFLRLPDGFPLGTGSERYGWQSLQRLLEGDIPVIDAVDGSAMYSFDDLLAVLTGLMDDVGPTDIHVQDYVGDYGDGDHSDHYSVAFLAQIAAVDHGSEHTLYSHQCYGVNERPGNVVGEDLTRKTDAFLAYSAHDPVTQSGAFIGYISRQYLVDVTPAVPPDGSENVAARASVAASSGNEQTGQTADRVVDDSVLGHPHDPAHEWATVGGGPGSWIQLDWDAPVTLSRVVLFDRPNADDHVVQATLVFSDGTTVETGELDNRGYRTEVEFTARTVTGVRLVVDEVSDSTVNVGLAEFQAWGSSAPSPL